MLVIEDENGKQIDSCLDGWKLFGVVEQARSKGKLENTHCLQFIDLYGDTTFNRLQASVLIEELASMKPEFDQPFQGTVQSVIDFLMTYQDRTHIYIKFYGD